MNMQIRESTRRKKAVHEDWRPADVTAELRKAGWSMRQLSFHHGRSEGVVRSALRTQYPRAERFIADALGVEPWDLWPSRYDDEHQPLRAYSKSSTARRGRNDNARAGVQA